MSDHDGRKRSPEARAADLHFVDMLREWLGLEPLDVACQRYRLLERKAFAERVKRRA